MLSVYDAKSHLGFLEAWIDSQPRKGYGLKSQLAKIIGTQTGFVTQVFNEAASFSLEQGIQIAIWMALNEGETQFFLLLLQRDRAASKILRDHFSTQIEHIRNQRESLAEQLKAKKAPSHVDQSIYFSSWIYSYIHVLLTCQKQITPEEIVKKTGLPPATVKTVVDFLVESKLAEETSRGYKTGEARLHIGTNSPHLLKHHVNWNLRAIQAFETDIKKGLHYSSVISLSQEDYEKARALFTKTLAEFKELVRLSEGEKVYGFTLNFFE